MLRIYTPEQWRSVFDCPSLIIDDQGLIWEADEYYKKFFGSPSGKVDYAAGKIYGEGLGNSAFEEPIAYLSQKNGVTEVRDAKEGMFSAPILYIKDNKIYTPEQYTSIFDNPSGYTRDPNPTPKRSSGNWSSSDSGSSSKSGSSGGGGLGGNLTAILGIGLVFMLPAIWMTVRHNSTRVLLILGLLWLFFAIIETIRHGVSITTQNVLKGLGCGLLTIVVVAFVQFFITNFGSSHFSNYNSLLNDLGYLIFGAGTFLGCLEKEQK